MHSVGHLQEDQKAVRPKKKRARVYLVHVPAERGSVIPEMDSIRDDLPALCEPMTAIMGKSMSICTLTHLRMIG